MTTASQRVTRLALVLGSLLAPACGGDDDGPRDWQSVTPPAVTFPEAGIRREVFRVAGTHPLDNPDTGDTTPAALDWTQVIRYREDSEEPLPARAVIIAYPGLLAGGASFEHLARHLVRRGHARGEAIEVWAIDRRSNLLEDLRGFDLAEAENDPEIAQGYYFGVDTIDGETFPGLVDWHTSGYLAEWGLATHVEDLRRVIALVPEASRRDHLFLMGHSMGAWFSEAYAAWRFADGRRGVEDLAGLILVDGLLHEQPLTEEEYQEGTSGSFLAYAGLDEIRTGGSLYFQVPFFGNLSLPRIEVLLMRALADPEAVVADEGRDDLLRVLLQLGGDPVPAMTNAAAAGLGLDDRSCSLFLVAVSCGEATGGSLGEYENAIAGETMLHPDDPGATYGWADAADDDPDDFTPLGNVAHAFLDGATNFAEWYYPERLRLDLAAAGGANLPEDGWAAAAGLRVFDGLLDDAPILGVAAGLIPVADFEAVRARVAAAVGAGRVNAGATRDQEAGFRVVDATHMTHIDPLTSADRDGNPVPDAVADFVFANAATGTVAIPVE